MVPKILLVDDTQTIATLLKVYILGWGKEVEISHATDGKMGLEMAHRLAPNVIISDVKMPGMDGFEFCAAIRVDPALRNTPVVLLTSLNDQASHDKGKLVGATAFLSKPVSPTELKEKIGGF